MTSLLQRTTRRSVWPATILLAALLVAACSGRDDDGGNGRGGGSTAGEARKAPPSAAFVRDAERLGCDVEHPEEQEPVHIGEGELIALTHEPYSSDPPTSGPHFGLVARWGFYERPVVDEYVVHNLEHGGVAVWYGGSPDSWRGVAREIVRQEDEVVISQRPSLADGQVAAAAWGRLLRCDVAAVREAGDDAIGTLLQRWVAETVDNPDLPEAAVPATMVGTRTQPGAYTAEGTTFAKLPALPTPAIDTTQDR